LFPSREQRSRRGETPKIGIYLKVKKKETRQGKIARGLQWAIYIEGFQSIGSKRGIKRRKTRRGYMA